MFKPITEETLNELRVLHDKIKNHPFRKSLERYKHFNEIIKRYVN